MLTGKPAFDGDDVSDTLANVLKREPDWDALPAEHHRPFDACCGDVWRRIRSVGIHDIADARLDLDEKEASVAAPLPSASRVF